MISHEWEAVDVMFCAAVFCNCGNCRVNAHKTHQIKRYDVSLGVRGLRDVLTELENNDAALIKFNIPPYTFLSVYCIV